RRRHTRSDRDWSSDVCSSDLTDDQAVGFIAALQFDLPRLKPKRNTRARIENRFVERVLAELRADFGKVRSEVNAFAVDLMTFDADRKSTRLNSSHDQISYAVF